jgi:phage gp16-like protein
MSDEAIDKILNAGKVERVAPDAEVAQGEIDDARNHLRSALALIDSDPVLAYTALYDASRKAVAAHMRAHGFRVLGKTGYHAKTMEYAEAALTSAGINEHLERLNDMRTIRNDAEYRGRRVGRAEIETDLETARRIVAAVEQDL